MILNLLNGSESLLNQVDWPLITQKLSQYSYFTSTKHKIEAVPKLNTSTQVRQIYSTYKRYLEFMESEPGALSFINNSGIREDMDFATDINNASKLMVLDISFYNNLVRLIEFFSINITDFFTEIDKGLLKKLTKNYSNEARLFIDPNGDLNYSKHPRIRELYEEVNKIESSCREKLVRYIHDPKKSTTLQIDSFDIIHDRYVLPIRSDSYNNNIGIIISRSDSGQTLYVEPYELRDLSNKRLNLLSQIDDIVSKLFINLNNTIRDNKDFFIVLAELIYEYDYYVSTATYFSRQSFCLPELTEKQDEIVIDSLFHPLIENPIKNYFEIKNKQGIVISGPNTGGKTAYLKSIALSLLFLHKGFFIPARYAKLKIYDSIFFFSNDFQDIDKGLSSFAAESQNYIHLIKSLTVDNFVIIDEIFNSTSSEEASALAVALIDYISNQNNVTFLISTHHQMLKTLIHQDERFHSAHVGFDLSENRPTYKIHFEGPGSSLALNIFKNFLNEYELPDEIVKEANKNLDHKKVYYETLLKDLNKKTAKLDKILLRNKELNDQLENQVKSNQGILKLKMEKELKDFKTKIDNVISEAQEKIRNNVTKKTIDQLYKKKSELITDEDKKPLLHNIPQSNVSNIREEDIIVGDKYFSTSLNQVVTVHEVKSGKATVSKGSFRLSVPIHTLSKKNVGKNEQVTIHINKKINNKINYDCRGMRLEEFATLLDSVTSDLLVGSIPFVDIIHGHGNGVLKNYLLDFFKKNDDFILEQTSEGNDGATRITLKN